VKTVNVKVRQTKKEKTQISQFQPKIDKLDLRLISLLTVGHTNKQISTELKIPLSTIQRRTRHLIIKGLVTLNAVPNYKQLGLKKGLIHIYLSDGNMKSIADKVSKMEGITSASVHIGNSDVVGEFVYKDSDQLLDIKSQIHKLQGVREIVWSEEILALHSGKENLLPPFRSFINGSSNIVSY